jgi:hypothetical protein
VNTNRQVFSYNLPTRRAALRGARWINLQHTATSFCHFGGGEGDQLIPGGIRTALRQGWMFDHTNAVQVLEDDQAETACKVATERMGEITATVRDPVVDLAQRTFVVFTFRAAFGKRETRRCTRARSAASRRKKRGL